MSAKFEQVKKFYDSGVWSLIHVKNAVLKGWITAEEYKAITKKDYEG